MISVARPLLVFGAASSMSLAAFGLTGGALTSDAQPILQAFSLGVDYYDLRELELLETTLYHVEESYVEPARIDYEKMYVQALEAVEGRVPVCMFRREPGGSLLHLEVGTTRTVFEVPKIDSRKSLQRELKRVAELLARLPTEDIPINEADEGDPHAQIEYAMVNGILSTLDPHSRLLPPEASKEMDVENQGEFGGLGITIVERKGRLTVEYPLPGTPAEQAGLLADDLIVRIDGVSTINMSLDEAVSKLRGPVGTPVSIEIMREGLTEPMPVTIKRAAIKINQVEGQLLEGGIGYVSIKGFHQQVESDLTALLARLDRESGGLRGLIIDLRDNPGGFLTQAEAVADMFLARGTIVSQVDSTGKKLEVYEARESGNEPKYPIAVLVNSSSASASEIVSGALRNNERAIIIGERTYGKGSVQNLHPFFDGSKLKLTISQYLTPGDRSIQAVGIPADIELVPTVVERKTDAKSAETEDVALLYWRERVHREADSDKHLEQSTVRMEEPAYSLRYLRPAEKKRRTTAALDLSSDFEVGFARDALIAATDARRADMLASAAPTVARYDREESKDIEHAFTVLGIDWSDGQAVSQANLDVRFDLGSDGVLIAGQEESIALEVTNRGAEPLYRLLAIATFEGDYPPREFFFGKLLPGETRRYEQKVGLVRGHPTELTPVAFSFRDRSGAEMASRRARLPVQGEALPRLSWQINASDAAPGGDGDRIAEVGERIQVGLTIENQGAGPTEEAFARVKNKSGRALDITRGTVEPGTMVSADGSRCAVLEAGMEAGNVIGDPATGQSRIQKGDPPRYAEGCKRHLAPGETWSGSFEVQVKMAPEQDLELDLSLGDAGAYDHATIVRGGFYPYFTNEQELFIPVGSALPTWPKSLPPDIQITQAPGLVVTGDHASISGVVGDETGIAHVEVFHEGDKVFFQGSVRGAHVRSVPFTADVKLSPGLNTFSVLATDENGFTDTSSVVTFYDAPEQHANAIDVLPMGEPAELERGEN